MIPNATIIRSPKRKRSVALRVEADGSLTVRAPMRTSLGWINAFIAEKAKWIARRQRAQAQKHAQPLPVLCDGVMIPFMGRELKITLNNAAEDKHLTDCLGICVPNGLDDMLLHDEIKTELTLWYKRQARALFQERIAHWAGQMRLNPPRVIVTSPQRRWGSCSAKNEIRLNWRLIMAAPELLDYVIVHELCHIPHKNHGPRFWALVGRFIPEVSRKRQALKKFDKTPFCLLFH